MYNFRDLGNNYVKYTLYLFLHHYTNYYFFIIRKIILMKRHNIYNFNILSFQCNIFKLFFCFFMNLIDIYLKRHLLLGAISSLIIILCLIRS